MTTLSDNAALTQALAEYEAAQRGYHDYFSNARGDVVAAFTVYVLEDAADAAIRALQADNAAKAERLREVEAKLEEVRETCQTMLAQPEAHRGSYTYIEYQPYEQVLDIVDPMTSDDPALFDQHLSEYTAWLHSTVTVASLVDWHIWHDANYPNCVCRTFRRASERKALAASAPADDAAAPMLYALDFDAYADWYRQTTGRDTPFEPHQLFTIEHDMSKVASEDYVYVHVASVPGCSMPRRFLKAWIPEPDDTAEGVT